MKEHSEDAVVPMLRLLYLSVFVLILQAATGYVIYLSFSRWEDRSSFGSMFGAVGTLFSGLAFAGIIYTTLLQRRDLELQQKALAKQARVMKLTARLTALNILAEAYKNRMDLLREKGRDYQQERNKLDEILHALEDLARQTDE